MRSSLLILAACADSVSSLAPDCAGCHADVAAEHAGSRHAIAGATELFIALREHLGDEGCDACHRPGDDDGVGCVTCHAAVGDEGPSDGRLLTHMAGVVQGSAARTTPHRVQAGFPADAALCGTCHDHLEGGALHTAPYRRWLESPARDASERCQDCHQRDVPGVPGGAVRHRWVGLSGQVDDAISLLQRALTLNVDRDGQAVTVTVVHTSQGHDLPDGASFLRDLVVEVDGALPAPDARLSAVWTDEAGEVADPRDATGNRGAALPPGAQRAWRVRAPRTVTACVRFTPERPALRRLLGLPVDPAREAAVDVVCASG